MKKKEEKKEGEKEGMNAVLVAFDCQFFKVFSGSE